MLVHTVLFWLKEGLDDTQRQDFCAGLASLKAVESLKGCYVGTPSTIDRPVVDTSYSFCLTTIFEDMAGHDIYQVHALHKAFLKKFNTYWDKVVIYDAN